MSAQAALTARFPQESPWPVPALAPPSQLLIKIPTQIHSPAPPRPAPPSPAPPLSMEATWLIAFTRRPWSVNPSTPGHQWLRN